MATSAQQINIAHLVSSIAHELYAPVTAIKGAVTTLIDHRHELDEDGVVAFLGSIDAETDGLIEILDCLVDVSRIQADTLRLRRQPIYLQLIVAEAVESLEARLGERTVEITGPDALVTIDAHRIQQVLLALLNSAIQPMSADAQLSIDVSPDAKHEYVIVSIHDHGATIPVDTVLERLEHLGRSGPLLPLLRLALSRALVELHGGRLWQSNDQIHFSLPLEIVEEV